MDRFVYDIMVGMTPFQQCSAIFEARHVLYNTDFENWDGYNRNIDISQFKFIEKYHGVELWCEIKFGNFFFIKELN